MALHGEKQPVPVSPALRDRDERLEALKLLAGRLAHDFNNSLAPLLGYLALIKEEIPAASPILSYVVAMEGSARKTENIVEEVLLATRPLRRFRPEQVNLTDLIYEQMELWRAGLPATTPIKVRERLQPCVLTLDRGQWRIVLQQLLSNAGFALATGGTLDITLSPQALTPEQATDLGVAVTDVFQLVVKDDGLGMSEETLRRAFEPFYSTRPKGQSVGLGLALVHSVVRCHGGQVTLESAQGAGTTVTIWLPVSPEEADALFEELNVYSTCSVSRKP
jgi:two-component system cell cycle sensor histidine kinase/response regulator CckA